MPFPSRAHGQHGPPQAALRSFVGLVSFLLSVYFGSLGLLFGFASFTSVLFPFTSLSFPSHSLPPFCLLQPLPPQVPFPPRRPRDRAPAGELGEARAQPSDKCFNCFSSHECGLVWGRAVVVLGCSKNRKAIDRAANHDENCSADLLKFVFDPEVFPSPSSPSQNLLQKEKEGFSGDPRGLVSAAVFLDKKYLGWNKCR